MRSLRNEVASNQIFNVGVAPPPINSKILGHDPYRRFEFGVPWGYCSYHSHKPKVRITALDVCYQST